MFTPTSLDAAKRAPTSGLARVFTIRAKILLAFGALAAITGSLGVFAVLIVVQAGEMVVETYDKPLMAISYARLALSDFSELQLTLAAPDAAQRPTTMSAAGRATVLGRELSGALQVAQTRSTSPRSADAAAAAIAAVAEWQTVRSVVRPGEPAGPEAGRAAAAVIDALDNLVELTAEDGFRGREAALGDIKTYRIVSIAATLAALGLGILIALLLSRRMLRPIAAASRAASRIAMGELDTEIIAVGNDEFGELLQSMSLMRDNIHSMMTREIAARRSAQSRLVRAIETSAEGIILADDDGKILLSNSQIVSFFPYIPGAFEPGNPLPPPLLAAIDEERDELQLADGRWLRLGISTSNGDGIVLIASDITVLKDRERVLLVAKEAAEAASRAKTEFFANMSHELRTPLNAVIGFSEIISTEMFGPVGNPKYKGFAANILAGGRHLLDIINQILDIAKLQADKITLQLEPVSIAENVDYTVRLVREQASSAGLQITCRMSPDLPMIEADLTRLRQILFNLLSNAIKFTPADGKITVSAEPIEGGVRVAVSDTGIGMAPDDIPRALEPFTQIESGLSRSYGGTGLGLPLSKLFTELHGGELTIDSELGDGTIVTLFFPLCPPQAGKIGPLADNQAGLMAIAEPLRSLG